LGKNYPARVNNLLVTKKLLALNKKHNIAGGNPDSGSEHSVKLSGKKYPARV
ncbi:hypothetical protein L9F63_006575, partial [Diploptera punctata]